MDHGSLDPLYLRWLAFIISNCGLPYTALVSDIMVENQWHWPYSPSEDILEMSVGMAHLVANGAVPDLVKWLTSLNGIYSAFSGSNALSSLVKVPRTNLVWFGHVPRLSFILWLAISRFRSLRYIIFAWLIMSAIIT